MTMAELQFRLLRPRDALGYADRAIDVADAVPDMYTESMALQVRGWVHYALGNPDAAMADYEAARQCAVRGGCSRRSAWAELTGPR